MSFYARHIHKTDSDLTLLNVKTPCFPFPPNAYASLHLHPFTRQQIKQERTFSLSLSLSQLIFLTQHTSFYLS